MEYSTSHLYFLCMKEEYTQVTSGIFHGLHCTTRECCITILLAIENTVANTINVTYARQMMRGLDVTPSSIQQLSCILIGCIFFGMV